MPEPDPRRRDRAARTVHRARHRRGSGRRGDPGLIRPIRAIAAWVGPIGAPLFAQLRLRSAVVQAPALRRSPSPPADASLGSSERGVRVRTVPDLESVLSGLNEAQREAATALRGPVAHPGRRGDRQDHHASRTGSPVRSGAATFEPCADPRGHVHRQGRGRAPNAARGARRRGRRGAHVPLGGALAALEAVDRAHRRAAARRSSTTRRRSSPRSRTRSRRRTSSCRGASSRARSSGRRTA
mgnify:CR=1 FL=1